MREEASMKTESMGELIKAIARLLVAASHKGKTTGTGTVAIAAGGYEPTEAVPLNSWQATHHRTQQMVVVDTGI